MLFSFMYRYQCFGGMCSLHLHGRRELAAFILRVEECLLSILNMGAASSFRMLLTYDQIVQCHILEDSNIDNHCRDYQYYCLNYYLKSLLQYKFLPKII
jgi:hypothetical protein